ncbi:hypothetical protein ACIOWI_34220 [Streptomyces sp. NPDC087659]|uniref:hypothetical protein n=1 Tax=Streptomyces sp. NPDC087659 TaxID=3365801 RepID=UPI003815AB18
MTELPEERQLAALRSVVAAAHERAEAEAALERAVGTLREAVTEAVRTGAPRGRVRELASISPSTLYDWLGQAGIEVRTKRSARKTKEQFDA